MTKCLYIIYISWVSWRLKSTFPLNITYPIHLGRDSDPAELPDIQREASDMLRFLRRNVEVTAPNSSIIPTVFQWIDDITPVVHQAMACHPTRSFALYLDLGNACASLGYMLEKRPHKIPDLLDRARSHFSLLCANVSTIHSPPSGSILLKIIPQTTILNLSSDMGLNKTSPQKTNKNISIPHLHMSPSRFTTRKEIFLPPLICHRLKFKSSLL